MLLVLLLSLGLVQDPGTIMTDAAGPGQWRLTITATDETDPRRLALRLRPTAARLCGNAGYHFGRYTFALDQHLPEPGRAPTQPDTLTLVQDMACGPPPPEAAVPSPAPVLSDAEAQALNPRLEALTAAYFAAVDGGRHAESFAMADPAMTGGATLEQWTERERRELETGGPVTERQVGRLTWYSNPPGAPPGHYGAVDYVASRTLKDECGYLIWYRPTPDAELRLIRQETTFLPRDLDPATLAELRRARCILL